MARPPRHAVAAVLVCLAALVAGCTVGPSQRPPVAVRGENMPVAPTCPADQPPLPDVSLPAPQQQHSSMPFTDCTEDELAMLPTPVPPDRTLRVECSELTVPADPDQPGTRRRLARRGARRPGLVSAGQPATARPGRLHGRAHGPQRRAARGAGGAGGAAAVHADRAGPPRRGRGCARLRARQRPRRPRRRRSREVGRVDAGLAAGAGPRGRAGVQPRARRRTQRLSHIGHGVGHRAPARTRSASTSCPRSVWATGPRPSPTGREPHRRRSAGSCSTAPRTPRSTSPTSARAAPGPPRRRSGRSPWRARPAPTARSARTHAPRSPR